jgi:phosphoglycerate dehydrogenase-like enzyme
MASGRVKVVVMAPHLGSDLRFVGDVDERIQPIDGNRAFQAELVEQGRVSGPMPAGAPSRGDRDRLLAEAEVLLLGFPPLPRVADRAISLQWAQHTQAGVSNLLRSDLWTSSVALTSSRGAVAVTAIAEYALAGIFHFARGLDSASPGPNRDAMDRGGYHMNSVAGSTLGVVGLGGIGREVARLARALGMRVIGTRRSVDTTQASLHEANLQGANLQGANLHGADLIMPASQLLELAAQSDFVVICSQLTAETRGMFDDNFFAALKPGSVLINVARGEEIVEAAMIDAIRSGRLRGALLDVYDGESSGQAPRPELLETPQIILTPHISASGDRAGVEPVKRLFAENLRRYLDGEPLLNLVDRARGY